MLKDEGGRMRDEIFVLVHPSSFILAGFLKNPER
jgi:hypothetical protein